MIRKYRRPAALVVLSYVLVTHIVVAWDYVSPHVCVAMRRRSAAVAKVEVCFL